MAAPPKMTRVFITGDVQGRLGALYERIEAITSSKGAFDCVLCVGEFLPSLEANSDGTPKDAEPGAAAVDVAEYITGARKVPIRTYFLGGADADGLLGAMSAGQELAPDMVYMGTSGVVQLHGLSVGFVSGIYDDDAPLEQSILEPLRAAGSAPGFGGVDVLMLNQWPSGITKALTEPPSTEPARSSTLAGVATALLKPRYAFAGGEDVAWARPAYACRGAVHVVRFVALASLRAGKQPKQRKSLHALQLTTLKAMAPQALAQRPAVVTSDPLAHLAPQRPNLGGGGADGGGRPMKRQRSEFPELSPAARVLMDRGKASGDCWFCLSSKTAMSEAHMLVCIGMHSYLALAKGGITQQNVLICPIQHETCFAALPAEAQAEIGRMKAGLAALYASRGEVMLLWERNQMTRGPQHMQIQAVGLPAENAEECRERFLAEGQSRGMQFQPIYGAVTADAIRAVAPSQYLLLELPVGAGSDAPSALVCPLPLAGNRQPPLGLAREVIAGILGRPELADWKSCSGSTEEETAWTSELQQEWAPHDFTQDGGAENDAAAVEALSGGA